MPRAMRIARWIELAFWGALLLSLLSCAGGMTPTPTPTPRPVKVSLALDWYPNANHAGLYLAQERGYFEDEGLEVDIFTPGDPATVLQTVASGRDDFGISYQVEVLLARQEEVPVVSVMGLVQHPLNSVMALKSSGIDRPGKLRGKTVGYPGIAYNVPMLETMLEHDGASIEEVEMVNVGFNLVPALIGGKVDAVVGAYFTHESIVAENQGHPVNVMRMEEWGVPDFYELVLVTSEKNLEERPDVVRKFIWAVTRGYQDAMEDPQAAIDILVDAYPEADEAVERPGVDILAPLWTGEVPGAGWQEEERWVEFADWMKENDLLQAGVDPHQAFTNGFVEEALGGR
jgi:putative hydroxymethylpyrimidine transport system substrate-binding protein